MCKISLYIGYAKKSNSKIATSLDFRTNNNNLNCYSAGCCLLFKFNISVSTPLGVGHLFRPSSVRCGGPVRRRGRNSKFRLLEVLSRDPLCAQGRAWIFLWLGFRFQGHGGRKSPARSRGTASVGIWGQSPKKQIWIFKFMKRRKAVFRIYAVHIHALILPVCVMRFKTK